MTTMTWSEDTSAGDPGDARGSALGQLMSMTECHLPAATVEGELTDRDGLDPRRRQGPGVASGAAPSADSRAAGSGKRGHLLIDTHGLPQ
jgi:hypothetical protein